MKAVGEQILDLLVLAIPVASIAWTVTHEEVFREPREWCERNSKTCQQVLKRKFFYLFTCEFCFSHYVAVLFLAITHFRLLFDDWRGYLIGGFSLVWIANLYMNVFARVRLDIKKERIEIKSEEQRAKQVEPPKYTASEDPELVRN